MKTQKLLSLFFLLLAVTVTAQNENKTFVIPQVQDWIISKGNGFVVTDASVVKINVKDNFSEAANLFSEGYGKWIGNRSLSIDKGKGDSKSTVSFKKVKDKKLGAEGYRIKVAKNGIEVEAQTERGAIWASQTLLQILMEKKMDKSSALSVPYGTILDSPKYAVRGFMLDCGRKFIPMDYLKSLVEMMSFYKMNTLQVHLNDNGFKQYFGDKWENTPAAFRLESSTYPGLAARDGHYSKAEFREFQIFANKLGIEIIPEFDVPAHSLAFSHYMPEIGSREYGMDHLDLFNEKTYTFLDGLFKEYLEGEKPVFVGKRVHIGTDEYSNKDTAVVEKFRYFTDRYIRLVESYGKQACVWGALTHAKGKTPVKSKNVVMNCWYNGYADPTEMKKQGYDLISIPDGAVYIVPEAGYYYDYLNTKYLYEKWTPSLIGNQTFASDDKSVLGGMFALWNDHAGNGVSISDLHHRIYPAMQTLSMKMWNGDKTSVSYEEFEALRKKIVNAPGCSELGLIGKDGISKNNLVSGETMPYLGAGYPYTVEFDIEAANEPKGTVLTSSARSVFYLSDPISGKLGYSRDGYLYTFSYAFMPGEKAHIRISGTNKSTSLFVNGRLMEEKRTEMVAYNNGKSKMAHVSTLFFPLSKVGSFASRITNFSVVQK